MQTLLQLQISRGLKNGKGRNKADLNTGTGKKCLTETLRKKLTTEMSEI